MRVLVRFVPQCHLCVCPPGQRTGRRDKSQSDDLSEPLKQESTNTAVKPGLLTVERRFAWFITSAKVALHPHAALQSAHWTITRFEE